MKRGRGHPRYNRSRRSPTAVVKHGFTGMALDTTTVGRGFESLQAYQLFPSEFKAISVCPEPVGGG